MKKPLIQSLMLTLALLMLLSGCGQKGDLYLPETESTETEEEKEDNND